MRESTIITISRQYGSGGKEIAEKLAEKMGVRCCDRQVLYLAAEKMGETDIESILDMSYQIPESRISNIGFEGFGGIPYYNRMYREQAKVILDIAKRGKAVFLGRCADAVLKEIPDHYSFFIYADEKFRSKRVEQYYENKSLAEMEKENRTREKYYNYYTGRKWGNPENYNLMINSSVISLSNAADLILEYIERSQEE